MNPATAFAATLVDELARCGLAEAVLAPGSRSAPLAIALWDRAEDAGEAGQGQGPATESRGLAAQRGVPGGRPPGSTLRLHVRIDERSAAFLALGLAKASRRPVALVCTSGTAAAHFHAAVIEASEAGVPLLVLTADRPPELRGTGANQAIDQIKLYGDAVRWFCEAGVPQARPGMNAYWRSLACRAWAAAAGAGDRFPGPVHLNLPLREPLVPGLPDAAGEGGGAGGWPEPLDGRPDGGPWTSFPGGAAGAGALELPWTERGVVICGDGCGDPAALLRLAGQAGWPVLAEPSSGARAGPVSLAAYPYLLDSPAFVAGHRPDLIVSAGRPGLSRGQLAYLNTAPPVRHVVVAQGPGHWADPARSATDVVPAVRLAGRPRRGGHAVAGLLARGRRGRHGRGGGHPRRRRGALRAAARAGPGGGPAGRRLAVGRVQPAHPRPGSADGAAGRAEGAGQPGCQRDRRHDLRGGRCRAGPPARGGRSRRRPDRRPRVPARRPRPVRRSRGAAARPGPRRGQQRRRRHLLLLEQAEHGGPFERMFGTPHGARLGSLAAAAGLPAVTVERACDLAGALRGGGIRVVEVRTSREAGAALRRTLRAACTAAAAAAG